MKITQVVDTLLRNTVEGLGYELSEIGYQKEHGNWVLTLYIESGDGITLEDCERVSRAVDPILDEADPIEQAYYLSVSSLGLDHPIKTDRDFERNLNKRIIVRLYAPYNKQKEWTGELKGFDSERFTIKPEANDGGEGITFLRKDAALIKPYIEF